jgi:hypothetical protein
VQALNRETFQTETANHPSRMGRKAAGFAPRGQDSRAAEVATSREAAPCGRPFGPAARPAKEGYRIMKLKLSLWVAVWVGVWSLGAAAPLPAQQLFKTERTVIYYMSPQDLLELDRRLYALKVSPPAAPAVSGGDAALPRLAAKVDGLLARVCQILQLSPENLPPVRIFLLQTAGRSGSAIWSCILRDTGRFTIPVPWRTSMRQAAGPSFCRCGTWTPASWPMS